MLWHYLTDWVVSDVLSGHSAIIFRVKQLKNDTHCSSGTAWHWRRGHDSHFKCQEPITKWLETSSHKTCIFSSTTTIRIWNLDVTLASMQIMSYICDLLVKRLGLTVPSPSATSEASDTLYCIAALICTLCNILLQKSWLQYRQKHTWACMHASSPRITFLDCLPLEGGTDRLPWNIGKLTTKESCPPSQKIEDLRYFAVVQRIHTGSGAQTPSN
jgi:hypothetical protein